MKYTDKKSLETALKELEPSLELDWEVLTTCGVRQLKEEMEGLKGQILTLTGDENFSDTGASYIYLQLLMRRVQSA